MTLPTFTFVFVVTGWSVTVPVTLFLFVTFYHVVDCSTGPRLRYHCTVHLHRLLDVPDTFDLFCSTLRGEDTLMRLPTYLSHLTYTLPLLFTFLRHVVGGLLRLFARCYAFDYRLFVGLFDFVRSVTVVEFHVSPPALRFTLRVYVTLPAVHYTVAYYPPLLLLVHIR